MAPDRERRRTAPGVGRGRGLLASALRHVLVERPAAACPGGVREELARADASESVQSACSTWTVADWAATCV